MQLLLLILRRCSTVDWPQQCCAEYHGMNLCSFRPAAARVLKLWASLSRPQGCAMEATIRLSRLS